MQPKCELAITLAQGLGGNCMALMSISKLPPAWLNRPGAEPAGQAAPAALRCEGACVVLLLPASTASVTVPLRKALSSS